MREVLLYNFFTSSIRLLYMLAGVGGDLPKSITHFVSTVVREGVHCELDSSNI